MNKRLCCKLQRVVPVHPSSPAQRAPGLHPSEIGLEGIEPSIRASQPRVLSVTPQSQNNRKTKNRHRDFSRRRF